MIFLFSSIFVFPSQRKFPLGIWSQKHKILCNYFKSHEGFCGKWSWVWYLESQWWWETIIQASDLAESWAFLLVVAAREECGHQVSDSVYMWWGARSPYLCLCVYTGSLFHLSPLPAIVFLLVSSVSECRRTDRRQAESWADSICSPPDLVSSFVNTGQSETHQHAGHYHFNQPGIRCGPQWTTNPRSPEPYWALFTPVWCFCWALRQKSGIKEAVEYGLVEDSTKSGLEMNREQFPGSPL